MLPLAPPATLTLAGVPETRYDTATPAAAGAVTIAKGVGFDGPGIAAVSAVGLQSEATFAAVGGKNNDAAAGSAAAAGIVGRKVVGAEPFAVRVAVPLSA